MAEPRKEETPTSRQRLVQGARSVFDNSAIVILIVVIVIVLLSQKS